MKGILLVDKPMEMTSFAVLNKLRKTLMISKIGHSGTLDPNATGLLMVLIGNATKLVPFLEYHDKEYIAEYKFGYTSNTDDIWGNITKVDYTFPSKEEILKALNQLSGEIMQTVPKVSAVHVEGKRLYEYEKEGKEVELPSRLVNIYQHELIEIKEDSIVVKVSCSKGTYIRSLAKDFGELIGIPCVISSLRRTRIGNYSVDDAYQLDDIKDINDIKLLSSYDVLKDYPYYSYEHIEDVLAGKPIELDCEDELVMIEYQKEIYAAYEKRSDGKYYCKRGLL